MSEENNVQTVKPKKVIVKRKLKVVAKNSGSIADNSVSEMNNTSDFNLNYSDVYSGEPPEETLFRKNEDVIGQNQLNSEEKPKKRRGRPPKEAKTALKDSAGVSSKDAVNGSTSDLASVSSSAASGEIAGAITSNASGAATSDSSGFDSSDGFGETVGREPDTQLKSEEIKTPKKKGRPKKNKNMEEIQGLLIDDLNSESANGAGKENNETLNAGMFDSGSSNVGEPSGSGDVEKGELSGGDLVGGGKTENEDAFNGESANDSTLASSGDLLNGDAKKRGNLRKNKKQQKNNEAKNEDYAPRKAAKAGAAKANSLARTGAINAKNAVNAKNTANANSAKANGAVNTGATNASKAASVYSPKQNGAKQNKNYNVAKKRDLKLNTDGSLTSNEQNAVFQNGEDRRPRSFNQNALEGQDLISGEYTLTNDQIQDFTGRNQDFGDRVQDSADKNWDSGEKNQDNRNGGYYDREAGFGKYGKKNFKNPVQKKYYTMEEISISVEEYDAHKEDRIVVHELSSMPIHNLKLKFAEMTGQTVDDLAEFKKQEIVTEIIRVHIANGGVVYTVGTLELLPEGYGFLRSPANSYLSGPEDVYVAAGIIRYLNLKTGDTVEGSIRDPKDNDKFFALNKIAFVNGEAPIVAKTRVSFDSLIPLYPDKRINLETERADGDVSMRIINLFCPIGKGQRALITAPPRTGKTILLQQIANAITANHPEIHLIVLLVDERPEEVTDMRRNVQGEVIASTFDEQATRHVNVAEMVIEKAKRLVEHKKDVVILLDSITRLARAYNQTVPASGKILSGGVDSNALHKPKRFFGAARNIENGGSLTIIASALIETGSRMDEVIFEEFKGTGNSEIVLDRMMAERRLFPAINIKKSGTRREDLLLEPEEANRIWILRNNVLNRLEDYDITALLVDKMKKTKNNEAFLRSMNMGNIPMSKNGDGALSAKDV